MIELGLALIVVGIGYRIGKAWKFEEPPLSQKRIVWRDFEREVNEDARRRLALAATERER